MSCKTPSPPASPCAATPSRSEGDPLEVQSLTALFSDLIKLVEGGGEPTLEYVRHAIDLLRTAEFSPQALREDILLTYRGRAIRPKTAGQKRYVDAIREHTITFGIGPAGTGKTYLAMAMAVAALKRKEVGRIILTAPRWWRRGRSLGFLPGDPAPRRWTPTSARSTTRCST